MKEFGLYIDGKWVKGSSGRTFETRNPANGELLAVFQEGTREDVVKAVESVQRAFPKWKRFPPPKRAAILLRAGQRLKSKAPRVLWEKEAGNRTKPSWKFKVAGTIPHQAFTGGFRGTHPGFVESNLSAVPGGVQFIGLPPQDGGHILVPRQGFQVPFI